jgi:hypothetical protein
MLHAYVEIATPHDGLGLLQLLQVGQEVLVPLLPVSQPDVRDDRGEANGKHTGSTLERRVVDDNTKVPQ